MTHSDDLNELILAYADGELDQAGCEAAEVRLSADPEARALLEIYRGTASLLRAAYPESLFAGGALPQLALPAMPAVARRAPSRLRRHGWAIAASLMLGLLGYGSGSRWPLPLGAPAGGMLAEIAEYHGVYSRETVHLVEADASNPEHIRTWLGNRVQRRIVIPDLAEAGLTFAGARMVALDGQAAAVLMYTRAEGLPIAFCIIRGPGPATTRVERHDANSIAAWSDGAHTFAIVGEAPPALIRDLVDRVRPQI